MLIDEHLGANGAREATELELEEEGGALRLKAGELDVELPLEILEQVMIRYGKPLADDVSLEGPQLELAGGRVLHRIRHRARYDVIARDFLVYVRTGEAPLVELSTSIAAALVHLARALNRMR